MLLWVLHRSTVTFIQQRSQHRSRHLVSLQTLFLLPATRWHLVANPWSTAHNTFNILYTATLDFLSAKVLQHYCIFQQIVYADFYQDVQTKLFIKDLTFSQRKIFHSGFLYSRVKRQVCNWWLETTWSMLPSSGWRWNHYIIMTSETFLWWDQRLDPGQSTTDCHHPLQHYFVLSQTLMLRSPWPRGTTPKLFNCTSLIGTEDMTHWLWTRQSPGKREPRIQLTPLTLTSHVNRLPCGSHL